MSSVTDRKLNAALAALLERVVVFFSKNPKIALAERSRPTISFDGETWTVNARIVPRNDARVRFVEAWKTGDTPEDAVETFLDTADLWAEVIVPVRRTKR